MKCFCYKSFGDQTFLHLKLQTVLFMTCFALITVAERHLDTRITKCLLLPGKEKIIRF